MKINLMRLIKELLVLKPRFAADFRPVDSVCALKSSVQRSDEMFSRRNPCSAST